MYGRKGTDKGFDYIFFFGSTVYKIFKYKIFKSSQFLRLSCAHIIGACSCLKSVHFILAQSGTSIEFRPLSV